MDISFDIDDWLREQVVNTTVWRATLSNGKTVIQDDDRPGISPWSAWIRLKQFLTVNNLKILNLSVAFRDNVIHNVVSPNADGYFFIKNAMASVNNGHQSNFYIFGWLENGIVHTKKYSVPELILVETSSRSIGDCGQGLIRNDNSY